MTGQATMKVTEVVKLLGISKSALYRAVERGELPSVRIGRSIRILRAPVEKMLAEGSVPAIGADGVTATVGAR